jgi:D-aminopeptidase
MVMRRARLRDLGISIGALPTGPLNAITDVAGVEVGHSTLIRDTPTVARSGVTMIWPGGRDIWSEYRFAGFHSFNGNGEMTGTIWLAEEGQLSGPIGITCTHCVGIVRDAICSYAVRLGIKQAFHLPVVGETWDGWLSDAESFPVSAEMAHAALDSARSGPVLEGAVGGGTGMICHEFKGGIGTASRLVESRGEHFTLGVLVQANYGLRELLRVDGVPVGREISCAEVPGHRTPMPSSSIIVILATDAPLLPIQCQRLARRATIGLAWAGGIGANSSGDLFLAFSTANRVPADAPHANVRMLAAERLTPLFRAAAEATEEAILNALTAAESMTGFRGHTIHALPLDRLQEVMARYRPRSAI